MRLTFGINDHVYVIEASKATMTRGETTAADEPADAPAIYDLSHASTQIRPQWDHEGPVPVARVGFQPNGGE